MSPETPQLPNDKTPRPIGYSEQVFGSEVLGSPVDETVEASSQAEKPSESDLSSTEAQSDIGIPDKGGAYDQSGPAVIGNPEIGIPDLDASLNPIDRSEEA